MVLHVDTARTAISMVKNLLFYRAFINIDVYVSEQKEKREKENKN